jgi:hypothetical protein
MSFSRPSAALAGVILATASMSPALAAHTPKTSVAVALRLAGGFLYNGTLTSQLQDATDGCTAQKDGSLLVQINGAAFKTNRFVESSFYLHVPRHVSGKAARLPNSQIKIVFPGYFIMTARKTTLTGRVLAGGRSGYVAVNNLQVLKGKDPKHAVKTKQLTNVTASWSCATIGK